VIAFALSLAALGLGIWGLAHLLAFALEWCFNVEDCLR